MNSPVLDAELRLTHEGEELSVWTEDEQLIVDAPSFSAAQAAGSLLDSPGVETDMITTGLGVVDLTIEVRIRAATVARIDPDARGGVFGRLLFGEGASLAPTGAISALFRGL